MKNPTTVFVALFVIAVLGAIGLLWWLNGSPDLPEPPPQPGQIHSFADCVAAGHPVMESYPAQCAVGGQVFVEDIGNVLEKNDLIFVDTVQPNQLVTSPLIVNGQARGFWFFEATFPVELQDANGTILDSGVAQAETDWMTEDFVPFRVVLEFAPPETETGTMILRKDNPSGLPEQDDALQFPVRFTNESE